MAFLKAVKGSEPGSVINLTSPRVVIGRHPNCEIVLDNAAVSRHHAQILESHGTYYLEDLRSRNKTYLNGAPVDGRTELNDSDTIKVCDAVFRFCLDHPSTGPIEEPSSIRRLASATGAATLASFKTDPDFSFEDGDRSSIITTLSTNSSGLRLGVKPEAKLQAVLDISKALARILNLDEVLQSTLDNVFRIFPQADEGFVLLKDPEKDKMLVRATKTRDPQQAEGAVRISMTIVRKAMEHGNAILSADATDDRRFDASESISDLRIRSMMCVPLVAKSGDAYGVIQLATHELQQQFVEDDLDMLASVASQVGLAVENAMLHEEMLKQRDMQRDLEFATQVQLGFLPNQRPKLVEYRFFDYYEPAMRVGGDYFDYIALPDGRVAIAQGDVAGKGVPAALLMARLYSSARFHLLTAPDLGTAVTGLNAEIASSGLGFRFITFVVIVIDPKKNTITMVNAGHLRPLMRVGKTVTEAIGKEQSGMPLGVTPNQVFKETTIEFPSGGSLLLYTDGISEAMNPQNEIYGRERLMAYLAEGCDELEELVHCLIEKIEEFCEGRPQRDDMCLVCIARSAAVVA